MKYVIRTLTRGWVKKMKGKETRDLESIALWIGSSRMFLTTRSSILITYSAVKEELCLLISIFYIF